MAARGVASSSFPLGGSGVGGGVGEGGRGRSNRKNSSAVLCSVGDCDTLNLEQVAARGVASSSLYLGGRGGVGWEGQKSKSQLVPFQLGMSG